MSVTIKVENLSKSYLIRHNRRQSGLRETDLSFRETLTKKVQKTIRQTKNIVRGNYIERPGTKEEFWALHNINFEIQQGERVGIIGRNGAGKSTLLKLLSRITEPTSGRISLKGRITSLLEVGTGFHAELTGRENIFLNGAILGMHRAEIKAKFDEIVDFSEVEKFIDTPVKRYSSGMYVRLAFAVAAFLESEILIIDEVLAVGDAEFQKKCLGKMNFASLKEGKTVMFVSHNMDAINTLCNKGILIKSGEIVDNGPINRVVSNYLTSDEFNKSFNHIEGNGLIKIDQVLINGAEFEGDIRINQEISVRVSLILQENIPFTKIHFFVVIFDESGNDVLSIFQKDSQEFFQVADLKEKIAINFINNLRPGTYKISIGMFNEFNEFLDWVGNCFSLRVMSQFNNDEPFDTNRLGKLIATADFEIL
jgi:lipopolysaccharide transport system ATP-binding protein